MVYAHNELDTSLHLLLLNALAEKSSHIYLSSYMGSLLAQKGMIRCLKSTFGFCVTLLAPDTKGMESIVWPLSTVIQLFTGHFNGHHPQSLNYFGLSESRFCRIIVDVRDPNKPKILWSLRQQNKRFRTMGLNLWSPGCIQPQQWLDPAHSRGDQQQASQPSTSLSLPWAMLLIPVLSSSPSP